jgi:hypothetical protein
MAESPEDIAHPSVTPQAADQSSLPVHFFTIVLNGEPFIRHHVEEFKKLAFCWHWHVVEGVAALRHDTAWSIGNGGRIPNTHRRGRSADGTSEYLDELAREYPNNITLYRLPLDQCWDGKRAMVAAPLVNIREECLLWEIDADEIWTVVQFQRGRELFLRDPQKQAARYRCWFFVGPNLVITTRNCYANSHAEWLRTWRFRPGMTWAAHEPPILAEPMGQGVWRDVAAVNSFTQEQTEAAGLVFQHYAYALIEQLRFKEQYYGYRDAVSHWLRLQQAPIYPARLGNYLPWVTDHTLVDRAEGYLTPLLRLPSPTDILVSSRDSEQGGREIRS